MWFDGWAAAGRKVRDVLRAFRDAGVRVDAVWMDWEGHPMGDLFSYEQASHCARCRATVPERAMANAEAFRQYVGHPYPSDNLLLELIGQDGKGRGTSPGD